jgi:uncharacterized membrane protein YqaE (UPF0057 family)
MKIKQLLGLSIIVTFLLGSCASSNEVTGGGFLQKRKYTNGIYFKGNGNFKGKLAQTEDEELEIAKAEELGSNREGSSTSDAIEKSSENEPKFVHKKVESTTNVLSAFDTDASAQNKSIVTVSQTTNDAANTIEKRAVEKQIESKNSTKKKSSKAPSSDVELILLVILALIIPPLAVFLFEGTTQRFWIDLILAIIGYGVGFWLLSGLGWICGLVSVIYALLIVLEVI